MFFGVCFKQQQQKDLFQAVHVNITLKSVLFCFESDKHLTKIAGLVKLFGIKR